MAPNKNFLTIAADNGGTNSGSGAGGGGYATLQYGSSGAGVTELQQTLNRLGYNVGSVDGIFGNNTKNAVLKYQQDHGLTADGIVGANTWNALNTPVTPTATPPVDYAGIIADLDKQQGGFQNAAAPTAAADRVQTATGTAAASPGELRAEAQAPTVTSKTADALADKVQDSLGKQTGVPDYYGIIEELSGSYPEVTDATINNLKVPGVEKTKPGTTVKPTPSSGYGDALASLGTLPNAAQNKNQMYSGSNIDPKPVTPSPSPGYEDVFASLGILPNAMTSKNQMYKGADKVDGTSDPDRTEEPKIDYDAYVKDYEQDHTPSYGPNDTPATETQTVTGTGTVNVADDPQAGTPGTVRSITGIVNGAVANTPKTATATGTYTPPERNPYYEPNYQRILQEMEAYPQFQYDPNADPIWASIVKQYRREGQRATADALGQYAAMTGGIPSTAAVAAATQAGDYYGAQLADRLQSVYNDAYQKYLDQYTRLMGLSDEYRSGMDFEEGQYTGDRSFDYGRYLDNLEAARLADETDYNRRKDERNFSYQQETDAYNRGRTAQADAQDRVLSYISMGGDPANIPADILSQSGYSTAELQQMQSYYAQQAALQAASGSGSGGGSSGGGSSGGGSSGGGSRGSGSGSGGVAESGSTSDIYGQLYDSGVSDYGTAYAALLSSGYGVTAAKELATYYAETYYPRMNGGDSSEADYTDDFAPSFTNAQQNGSIYVSGYGWLTESELNYRIGKGDINTRQNMNGTYTYVPKGMSGGDYKGTEVTGSGTNNGSNTIGANDAIRFNYDEDEGIFTLNGNTFSSPDKLLSFLNNHKWTEAQKNYIVQKVLPYIPDMTAKAR